MHQPGNLSRSRHSWWTGVPGSSQTFWPVNWAGKWIQSKERDHTMATEKTNNSNGTVPVVEEIGNWTTTKSAAELMGVELPSVGAIIHAGRVKAIRIAGVFLVDKSSAIEFGKRREAQVAAEQAKRTRNDRLATLSKLTDEQLEHLLSQVEVK
jgi:hypothetical protein